MNDTLTNDALADEIRDKIINTPETADFMAGVPIEAAHQRERWGAEHDAGKSPFDWFWLIGYLAQKAASSAAGGDIEKAKHHTISTAATLANWHAALSGKSNVMRPGIDIAALHAQPVDAEPSEAVVEAAIGGKCELPDGRNFWIDAPVARLLASRVVAALASAPQNAPLVGEGAVDRSGYEQAAWDWLDGMVSAISDEHPSDIAYSADQMVDAYAAGSAFTRSPASTDDEAVRLLRELTNAAGEVVGSQWHKVLGEVKQARAYLARQGEA